MDPKMTKLVLKKLKLVKALINAERLTGVTCGVWGNAANCWGDATWLYGPLSKVRGDLSDKRGIISPRLTGDISGLSGDLTGLGGNATGIVANGADIVRELKLAPGLAKMEAEEKKRAHKRSWLDVFKRKPSEPPESAEPPKPD